MTLSLVSRDPATGAPTRFTVRSDKRVSEAVAEVRRDVIVTVAAAGEEARVIEGSEVVKVGTPRTVAPITATDSRSGVSWKVDSDDGVTTTFVLA